MLKKKKKIAVHLALLSGVEGVLSSARLTPGLKALPEPMKFVEGPGRGLTSYSGSTAFCFPVGFFGVFFTCKTEEG
jgi:hypothetical protein